MLSYVVFTLTIGGIYALLALSLNLAWGTTGMVNLGLAGFFTLGGYTTALVSGASGAPIMLGMLAAVLFGIFTGAVLTFATLRLRDDYLAIVTLGFAEVLRLVALNERWLSGGAEGLSGIPGPLKSELGPFGFNLFFFGLVTVTVAATFFFMQRLDQSPYGRVLKSIREDQELVAFAGKPVLRFKLEAFALAAGVAALAGAIYVHYLSFISPEHFQPLITIYIFLAVSAGGAGRPLGVVFGAYLVVIYIEATRFVAAAVPGISSVQSASVREMLVGTALLCVLLWRPGGIFAERLPKADEKFRQGAG